MTRLRWFSIRKYPFRGRKVPVLISKNTGTIYLILRLNDIWRGKGRFTPWYWRSLYVDGRFIARFKFQEDAKEEARRLHELLPG